MRELMCVGIVLAVTVAMQLGGCAGGNRAATIDHQSAKKYVHEDIPPVGTVVRTELGEKMMVQNDYEVETVVGTRISPNSSVIDVAVLYDAPSPKAKPMFELKRDSPVEVIIGAGDWVKVRTTGGRIAWVEKNAVTDAPREVITLRAGNIQRVIEYTGRSENRLTFSYREYTETKDGVFIRPAYTQDLTFDLAQGSEIGVKGARVKIIEATNTGITYQVLKHFPK